MITKGWVEGERRRSIGGVVAEAVNRPFLEGGRFEWMISIALARALLLIPDPFHLKEYC